MKIPKASIEKYRKLLDLEFEKELTKLGIYYKKAEDGGLLVKDEDSDEALKAHARAVNTVKEAMRPEATARGLAGVARLIAKESRARSNE